MDHTELAWAYPALTVGDPLCAAAIDRSDIPLTGSRAGRVRAIPGLPYWCASRVKKRGATLRVCVGRMAGSITSGGSHHGRGMAWRERVVAGRGCPAINGGARQRQRGVTWRSRHCGCGARGRNRTGTPCGEGFSCHFGFRRHAADAGCSWSGARLHHSLAAVGARRLLSTPSRAAAWAWLGVGSDVQHPGRSPNLTGVTSEVSP